MNVFLYTFWIFLVAVVCLDNTEAAEIKSLNKGVRVSGIVPEDNITKGSKVCIFDGSEEIGCGTVSKVSKSGKSAYLKVKKALKKKLKTGMSVRSDSGSSVVKIEGGSRERRSSNPTKIFVTYSPLVKAPTTFKKIAYEVSDQEIPDTWWEQGESSGSALIGFGLGAAIPVGKAAISTGVRYSTYTNTIVDADYNNVNKNLFVRTELSATSIGLWGDFVFSQPSISMVQLGFFGGLDLDLSTLNFVATKKDDGATAFPDEEIASSKSNLTVISLRAGAVSDLMFLGSFGTRLSTTVLIPVAQAGLKASGKAEDTQKSAPEDPGADLQSNLAHSKSSFGFGIDLGVVISF